MKIPPRDNPLMIVNWQGALLWYGTFYIAGYALGKIIEFSTKLALGGVWL